MRLIRIMLTTEPASTILTRVVVGGIFSRRRPEIPLPRRVLYPGALGAGRFVRIGIPAPKFTGPFVGCVEIADGLLLLMDCSPVLPRRCCPST